MSSGDLDITGNIVDVLGRRIYAGTISVRGGRIEPGDRS